MFQVTVLKRESFYKTTVESQSETDISPELWTLTEEAWQSAVRPFFARALCWGFVPTVTKRSSTMVTAEPFKSTLHPLPSSVSLDPLPSPSSYPLVNENCFDLSLKWSWHFNKQYN